MKMKNKIITHYMLPLLMAIGMTSSVYGQSLHSIIFANTSDPKIGESVLKDYYALSVEVNTIASATGLKLKTYYYKDEKCCNKNLRNVLDQLKTNKDDVIIFYYSGHGARSVDDISEFPQMCLGSSNDSDLYPLEKVLKKLNEQPARLKIVMGDCCNGITPGVTPKNYETRSVTILSKEPVGFYNGLFSDNQGFMIASSSKKGELSAGTKDIGGIFTASFLSVMKYYASKGMSTTWDKVMANTKDLTYDVGQQTPVYAVRIKNTTTSAPSQYQEPQNTAQDGNSDDIEMIRILTAIGNDNLGVEERVQIQDKALKYLFNSPKAKVEVVASNGSTIVATERAEDFVLRLCTSHNLVNLVEVDCKLDNNGRYTYLKVHEIYKK